MIKYLLFAFLFLFSSVYADTTFDLDYENPIGSLEYGMPMIITKIDTNVLFIGEKEYVSIRNIHSEDIKIKLFSEDFKVHVQIFLLKPDNTIEIPLFVEEFYFEEESKKGYLEIECIDKSDRKFENWIELNMINSVKPKELSINLDNLGATTQNYINEQTLIILACILLGGYLILGD